MIKIAPSLLSADFARLGEQAAAAARGGADLLHVDVMDGRFVPNISFGASVMKSLNGKTGLKYDVHLMIEEPDRYIEDFVTADTEFITVHQEACVHLHRTLAHIRDCGVKPGVALNPATPLEMIAEIAADADLILIMSVNPGFGGQKFIASSLSKLARLSELKAASGAGFLIEVDGGVTAANAAAIRAAGADVLVAGSSVFGGGDEEIAARIAALKNACRG